MIAKDDAIIAMSWSGESAELKGIVAYSRRFSIPLIAITSGEGSALAREADVVLLLPRVPEACPHGLAPTTSTLLQLVVGDALAVALLEARGFTPDHFRTFHPGGQLGASLMQVREIMHQGDSVPVAALGSALRDAIVTLSRKRFGCVCIVDDGGRLAGIITDGDLARNLDRNLGGLVVDDIMTRTPKTIDPDMLTGEAIAILDENRISALVVVEDGKPVGIVHFHDLLQDRRGLTKAVLMLRVSATRIQVRPAPPPVPDRDPSPPSRAPWRPPAGRGRRRATSCRRS